MRRAITFDPDDAELIARSLGGGDPFVPPVPPAWTPKS
jgi:hypothetical protein